MPPQKTQNKLGHYNLHQGFPVAQLVKNLPAMRETWVQSLGWEDPLEKGTATHSSILAWRILWTETGGLQPMGWHRGPTFISHYNLYQFILLPLLIKSYKAEISRFKQISSLQKNTCHISMAVTI